MKPLTGRRLQIATTGGGLEPAQVATARASYAARGFEVPPWTGPPLPEIAPPAPPPATPRRPGPGSVLAAMFARWGIEALGCSCKALARKMDEQGPAWCRRHLDELAAEIAENAQRRDWLRLLPFKRYGARRLILRAINAAETPDPPAPPASDHARDQAPAAAELEDLDDDPPEAQGEPAEAFLAGDYRNTGTLYNRDGRPVALHQVYRGAAAFLLGGGPSLADVAPDTFHRRGLLTMAVNNAAALFRPQLWTYVDAPGKFLEQVWRDPAVAKFAPLHHFPKRFRVTGPGGYLVDSPETIGELPNVYGYRRNAEFHAERFLWEPSFSWGCGAGIVDDAGVPGTRTVFLVALKLLFWLGVRTVYLVGVDWKMDHRRPYAFEQAKDPAAAARNNHLYRVTGQRLARLRPHFEAAGFRVINATPGSALEAFPRLPLAAALEQATRHLPAQLQTAGRY